MGTRGKKSVAALSVAMPVGVTQRPDAPYDLTDEQSEEWWAVVNRMPADWFPRETHALLAQYCRHVVTARRVAQLIADAENPKAKGAGLDVDAYDKLLKLQEREGRAMSSLATRMRLTQQTTYDPKRKKPIEAKRPWEA
jgi:hypothetical protein